MLCPNVTAEAKRLVDEAVVEKKLVEVAEVKVCPPVQVLALARFKPIVRAVCPS